MSVVILDTDVLGALRPPLKSDAPLVVDADGMAARAIS